MYLLLSCKSYRYKSAKLFRALKNYLTYKSYKGSIEYSDADSVWYGKILDLNDLVSYEASSREDLQKAFVDAVQNYSY